MNLTFNLSEFIAFISLLIGLTAYIVRIERRLSRIEVKLETFCNTLDKDTHRHIP